MIMKKLMIMKKFMCKSCLLLVSFMCMYACSDDESPIPEVPEKKDPPKEIEEVWTVNKDGQKALNVVYFKPRDFLINDAMTDGISSTMLYVQAWYEKQMEIQGYGAKTFGLLTNQDGKVKVHVVKAPYTSTFYDERDKVTNEVKKYFTDNPKESASEHTIILGLIKSGVGAFGLDRWAQVGVSSFDLESTGIKLGDFELKSGTRVGLILHELGHGLNLPHNSYKASENPKVSLMGYGNARYKDNPDQVFLTKSSCAILNSNTLFNKSNNGINYYQEDPIVCLNQIDINKLADKNSIQINASFSSSIKVTHAFVGFDFVNEGAKPPNDNYDEITFTTVPSFSDSENTYHVQFTIPYSELFNGYQSKNKDETEISLNVVCENGTRKVILTHSYTTDVTTMIPNDDILHRRSKLKDRSTWTAKTNSSMGEQYSSSLMFDGDFSSYWFSRFPYDINKLGAHTVTIDMGSVKEDIQEVYLYSYREDDPLLYSSDQFRPRHFVVETSIDGVAWEQQSDHTVGSLSEAKEIIVKFDQAVPGRYLRIAINQVFTSSIQIGASLVLSEVDIR